MNQYPGITTSISFATSLLTRQNGIGIFSSAGKSALAKMVNVANFELCFKLTHSPGQNPRSATISPSALRLLWLLPIVAPAAILLCPNTSDAHKNELL